MTSLKNTLRTCVALSAVSIVSSCVPNMDLNNPEQLSVDTYYTTEAQLEASIIPAYEALIGQNQGGYARALYYNLLAPGDDFDKTFKWPNLYQDTYSTPANEGLLKSSWQDLFNGVFASNIAIEKITHFEGTMDDGQKRSLLGEALFFKSFYIICIWFSYLAKRFLIGIILYPMHQSIIQAMRKKDRFMH